MYRILINCLVETRCNDVFRLELLQLVLHVNHKSREIAFRVLNFNTFADDYFLYDKVNKFYYSGEVRIHSYDLPMIIAYLLLNVNVIMVDFASRAGISFQLSLLNSARYTEDLCIMPFFTIHLS